ncbi:MAG: protein-L-isoaspartate(D-aspartate) O-methyltransferase [Chloroflexi bacterium]|nr:MAG: protein-L-isoaspartate(D-aspartate) O-methyltransferase [Chloroflexota bacterium]
MAEKKNLLPIEEPPELAQARAEMVEKQLKRRYINDPRILEVMGRIPRHIFVDERMQDAAYRDGPLPIGHEQTISQPYIVAYMTQALQLPRDNSGVVLEVGTGSGYQAAVLSQLAERVYTIERIPALAKRARQCLDLLGIDNVEIKVGDGGYGWPEHAPYDGIIVTAAAPEIPAPLKAQLKDGGRLVIPIGPRWQQELVRLHRRGDRFIEEELAPVAFVPLIGEHGWDEYQFYE